MMVPLSALAQVDNSEASVSGRGEESCRGAAHLMSGFGTDPSTTFAGELYPQPWDPANILQSPNDSQRRQCCLSLSKIRMRDLLDLLLTDC